MKQQFVARFLEKFGDGDQRDQEYTDHAVNFNELHETKLKPFSIFIFEKAAYLYDRRAVKTYDKNDRPIIRYLRHDIVSPDTPASKMQMKFDWSKIDPKSKEKIAKILKIDENGKDFLVVKPLQEQSISIPLVNGKEINADLFYEVLVRGEAKNVIAASQKEPTPLDRTSLIMGLGTGAAAGALAIVMVVIGDPHLFFPNGLSAKGMIEAGLNIARMIIH